MLFYDQTATTSNYSAYTDVISLGESITSQTCYSPSKRIGGHIALLADSLRKGGFSCPIRAMCPRAHTLSLPAILVR